MAPSDVSSVHKQLLQTSDSSTQEPTTVIIEGSCENSETEQNGIEESDFEGQRKISHKPNTGTDPKTFVVGKKNDTIDDNTQIENTVCTCDGVIEEVAQESDSEEREKTTHSSGKGDDPKTFSQGKENDTVEDNTQIVNTSCTSEGVIDEVTKESDSEGQEKTTHNSGKGNDPQTFAQGKENDTLEDDTQIENTPSTCDNVIKEETEETSSKREEKTTHPTSTCENINEEVTGKEK